MKQIILMSIQPEWVAKILNGEKTIEVRKHALKEGDEVHIYCTEAKPWLLRETMYYSECGEPGKNKKWEEIQFNLYENVNLKYAPFFEDTKPILNGKVVAKFIVGKVEKIDDHYTDSNLHFLDILFHACLTVTDYFKYSKNKDCYALSITQLEVFDKPRELHDYFKKDISEAMTHWEWERADGCHAPCPADVYRITHAPQSYMRAWVEE